MASEAAGFAMVLMAGVLSGCCVAPIKRLRRFRFEHWSLVAALAGQVVLPWAVLWATCPRLGEALAGIDSATLIAANLLSAAWGVANVLYGLCLVRIGFSLSVGLLTGIGLPIGVLLPLLLPGSGAFAHAPALSSTSGVAIAGGTLLMLVAVILFAGAGMRRDGGRTEAGGFRSGLWMAIGAGVLQAGLGMAFVYTQGPVGEALRAGGAGELPACIGVWAVTLPGGAAIGIGYAAVLMTRRRSWDVLLSAPLDWLLSLSIGLLFFLFVACLGAGMLWLGALGGSIGFGIYQASQLGASQVLGILCGEWRHAPNAARRRLHVAILIALIAVAAIAAGRWLAVTPAATPPSPRPPRAAAAGSPPAQSTPGHCVAA